MLVDTIRKDRMRAMKAGNEQRKSILTVLLGDIENKAKGGEMGDSEVIALIKKYVAVAEENAKYEFGEQDTNKREAAILAGYLPQQLSKDEIESILCKAIKTGQVKHIGDAMKFMKTHYDGQYDGKVASQRAKYLLTRD